MDRSDIALAFIGTVAISYVVFKLLKGRNSRLPPSITRLPIVGSLPFVPDYKLLHKFFLKKADELGGVIGMQTGSFYMVILNNRQSVQEALVKHSLDFAGRPVFYTNKTWMNVHQKGIVDYPYGAEFLRQQKLIMSILKDFGFGQSVTMETRILGEVSHLVQKVRLLNGRPFWPDSLVKSSVFNVIIGIVKGGREEEIKAMELIATFHKLIQESSELFVIDAYPVLQYLPSLRRKVHEVQGYNRRIFEYIDYTIGDSSECSFIKYYIDRMGSDYEPEQLQYIIRDLLIGGTETSAKTLLWSIYLLAGSEGGRVVQEKMRQEISSVVSRDRLPSLDDRGRLPYVEATTCEILRIRAVLPLAIPHETLHDTVVDDFRIPAHTMIVPNLYAVHMDPAEWQDPSEFRPERFLDASGNVITKEKIMPFSLGRRSCLGELLARQEIFLFLTALIQNFILQPPEGQDTIECEDDVGFTMAPSPFDVRLIELPSVD